MSCLFPLPTTGAVAWTTFLTDPSGSLAPAIARTSNARGRVRSSLKKCKRTEEDQRDWGQIVQAIETYLPCLNGIMTCIENDSLLLQHEPTFSWRATLSSHKIKSSPRVELPSLHYELVFTLLTLALATANSATAAVEGLGDYERLRHTSETERKRLDEAVNTAAEKLCRASSILDYLSATIIPRWEVAVPAQSLRNRPAETSRELTSALAKVCHADAERLAIRRLMTKAISDSTLTPGHPLPRSHPSPSLLSKLFLNVASLYETASGLLTSSSLSPADALKRYIAETSALSHAMAHKWLGVDKGERDSAGEATAWLTLAKEELKPLAKRSKGALANEVESVESFLSAYKRLNDTVSFQPVPKPSSLLALVPGGRAALTPKPYALPSPAFTGGKSNRPLDLQLGTLDLDAGGDDVDDSDSDRDEPSRVSYAGKGGYF